MRKLFLLTLLLAFLSNPLSVYAQNSNSSNNRETRQNEIQQRIDEKRLEIEKKRAEIKNRIQVKKATASARLTEARKARVRAYWFRLEDRLEAAIARLEKLIIRIESRLAKIEEADADIDTSSVQEQLDEAKDLLNSSLAKLEASGSLVEEVLSSEDPKAAFLTIKDTIKKVKDDLVEVHRILVQVIGDIKGLRVGQNVFEATKSADQ